MPPNLDEDLQFNQVITCWRGVRLGFEPQADSSSTLKRTSTAFSLIILLTFMKVRRFTMPRRCAKRLLSQSDDVVSASCPASISRVRLLSNSVSTVVPVAREAISACAETE
jgi:hypothetical protein